MAMLQVTVFKRLFDLEVTVVTKQFVTRSHVNIVAVEGNSTQAAVSAPALEIDITRIPVDVHIAGLSFEIHGVDSAMALALLAAADHGCCNEFWEWVGH